MSVVGKVHRPGVLTGMTVQETTLLPGQDSVYLAFQTANDEQESVELSVEEAVALHGWLTDLMRQIQDG